MPYRDYIPSHHYTLNTNVFLMGRAFSNMMTVCLGLAHEEVGSFLAIAHMDSPNHWTGP